MSLKIINGGKDDPVENTYTGFTAKTLETDRPLDVHCFNELFCMMKNQFLEKDRFFYKKETEEIYEIGIVTTKDNKNGK